MKMKLLITLLFAVFALLSCEYISSKSEKEKTVARVYESYLYESDLAGIVEPGISGQDSIIIMRRYIDTWVRQQLLLNEAQNNLAPEQMNFEKKIQDYKNSLIIFSFETDYIKNNLDTVVSNDQIQKYYDQYMNDFRLKENIVMASFVKISLEAPDQNILRKLFRSDKEEDRSKLEEYCVQNAAAYIIDNKSWMIFAELLKTIPIEVNNQEYFLRNNKLVELSDDFYRYFLLIHDYKLKESVSPLAFEEKNIRNIIINKRKHQLITDFRNELYRDAIRDNAFEVFK
jgi:hypothetical protein